MILRRLIAALLVLVGLAGSARAEEAIQSYVANIIVGTDASVDVTETITVNVEGNEIRRGIYRDIPTAQINDDKSRLRSDLDVISVLRDGRPEPYAIEDIGNGVKRIRIGDADVYLPYGNTTYTIHYTMSRMARSIGDTEAMPAHDELYWNVTGNFWVFPINKVTATVQLPSGVKIERVAAYTGVPGSLDSDVATTLPPDQPNVVNFRTTRVFAAGDAFGRPSEGLSVVVAMPAGTLAKPEGLTAFGYWLSDHRDLVFPTFAVFFVLLYNLFAWNAVGRDPAKGTIIPLFYPPKGYSPALVHYVNAMGFKQSGWTAFTASIFDLGVKGLLEISKPGKSLVLKVLKRAEAGELPPGEAALFSYLNSKGSLQIDKESGPKLNEKRGELVTTIEKENRQRYFRNNYGYVVLGVAISILMLGALVWLDVLEPVFLIVAFVASIAIGIFVSLFSGARSGNIVGRIVAVIWFTIFGANALGGLSGFFTDIRIDTGLVAAISIFAINVVFAVLMRAPTVQGRKLMDQIDGFKMYLETAEKERLNFKDEPQMTVKRFEAILPFAIALGVEKPWSQRFEGELARNTVPDATGTTYSPAWYSGGSDWSSSSGGFANSVSAVSAGMTAAVVAAQPTSSSSSGFSGGGGGGGGSGGGGGGGGGGGW